MFNTIERGIVEFKKELKRYTRRERRRLLKDQSDIFADLREAFERSADVSVLKGMRKALGLRPEEANEIAHSIDPEIFGITKHPFF